jgi:NADH-quinone oxidoreductase subunit G
MATASLRLPANSAKDFAGYLSGHSAAITNLAFREALLAEESLVVTIAGELSGQPLVDLIAWGLERGNVRFALLGAYANSRGAADMGLDPALLPGYLDAPKRGLDWNEMLATDSGLEALLIAGANPAARPGFSADAFRNKFVVVQDIFLTETAALADVVLPAASLYEKTGTVTNAFGDVQTMAKAADYAQVKPDFEILVRMAGAMGAEVKALLPFSRSATTADLGQSRGAEAGEADRHAVALRAQQLAPRLSPFNPMTLFDEIVRTVPGYAIDRLQLLTGNTVATEPGLAPASPYSPRPGVEPAGDTLFTSGTLGRHSKALGEIALHQDSKQEVRSA